MCGRQVQVNLSGVGVVRRSSMVKKSSISTSISKNDQRQQGSAGTHKEPLVGIIMGSSSDWETMEHAAKTLDDLGVPYETRVVSAHRTPDLLFEYAAAAEKRGIEVIIAGAGGAAHLPGMTSAKTVLPVLGVPVESKTLKGLDSLLSIAQMPGGVPVGTLAIGKAGAINSALLAAAILGAKHPEIREALRKFRTAQSERVLANPDPTVAQASAFALTSPPAPPKRKPA
jgi:5-(carboxyamino)imidazole ribonucleotide mutase